MRNKQFGMILFFAGLFLFLTIFAFNSQDAKAVNDALLCHLHKKTDTIGHIISVNENAVPGHLNHGDTELSKGTVGDECDTAAGCSEKGEPCNSDADCCQDVAQICVDFLSGCQIVP